MCIHYSIDVRVNEEFYNWVIRVDHLPNDIVGVEDILLALLEVLAESVVVDEASIPGSVVLEVDSPLAAEEGGMSSGQDLKCIFNQFVWLYTLHFEHLHNLLLFAIF